MRNGILRPAVNSKRKSAHGICFGQVMMAHERCGEEDAEAILSNLKMEGRLLAGFFQIFPWIAGVGCREGSSRCLRLHR